MRKPFISIIVPVYNVENCVRRCLDSIVEQVVKDWELILVDDGSKDASGKICDDYACKDERIKVYHRENGGVSAARNFGLEQAQGTWITFIDSDDYIGQDYFAPLTKADTDIVVFSNMFVCKDGSIRSGDAVPSFSSVNENEIKKYLETNLYKPIFNVPWGKAFKSEIVKDVRFPIGQRLSEDTSFVYETLSKIGSLSVVQGATYYWLEPNVDYAKKYHLDIEEAIKYAGIVYSKYRVLNIFCPQKELSILSFFIWNAHVGIFTDISPYFKVDFVVEIEKRLNEKNIKLPKLYLMFKNCKVLAILYMCYLKNRKHKV